MNSLPTGAKAAAYVVGVVVTFLVLFLLAAACSGGFQSGQPGQVGVVRNGAFWNGSGIRGTIQPGASVKYVGIGSNIHFYPAGFSQRQYTISSVPGQGERPGVDVVSVPTSDGIQVGLEGTIYFHDAFDGTDAGNALLEKFDASFGVRTYPIIGEAGSLTHAYNGDTGWSSFLDAVFRPVIDNELRQAIGSFKCEQLLASCALVTQGESSKPVGSGGADTQTNIQKVQDQINSGLQDDLNSTLGQPYFTQITFRLSRVTPPEKVQNAINTAQASFAQVTQQRAQVNQSRLIAQANRIKAKTYRVCPACAVIDELKAMKGNVPAGVTVLFGVGNPNVTVPIK